MQIGDAVQPIVRGPLTVSDMIAWMMGIGSPHIRSGQYWLTYRRRSPKVAVRDPETNVWQAVERVHWDPFMAAEIGMPAPYDYGSQRGAWATHLMTNWCGDDGWVAEVDVEYRGMNFLGDTTRISGKVTDKWRGAKTGIGYVGCKIDGHEPARPEHHARPLGGRAALARRAAAARRDRFRERRQGGVTQRLPLAGLRVLDFTHAAAGPYATLFLGDMGAEIIKIERPPAGDGARTMGSPMPGFPPRNSEYYLSLNRNKRGIALDLERPEAVKVAQRSRRRQRHRGAEFPPRRDGPARSRLRDLAGCAARPDLLLDLGVRR